MSKRKSQEATEDFNFWKIIGILAIIYFVWHLFYGDLFLPKYDSDCVDSCVSDMEFCANDYSSMVQDKYNNNYITEEDYTDCFYELESCVLDCAP